MSRPAVRCAIYTRKSSEEGLDQGFNSLHAQREACEAYVKSQIGEGWMALPKTYDDGGYSGGSMERPGLEALLADVAGGRVDVVVVYKVDRLTRSLADFAKIVDAFDAKGVSFVSVTQAFNTTTSMGRLTLNVLLSFAQFEREVTGERIRDKIAASKAKGMWMGGNLPLGYDRPTDPQSRALVVNPAEAETVRLIFAKYLELRSVHALLRWLAAQGIRSKAWISSRGRAMGGAPIGRGALFHLLKNCTYIGMVPHRNQSYPGQHAAIVERDLFDQVQVLLADQARQHRLRPLKVATMALRGLLFDADGQPMSPSYTSRAGRTYRYYVSAPLLQGGERCAADDAIRRVGADRVEAVVMNVVARLWGDHRAADLRPVVRVEVHPQTVQLVVQRWAFFARVGDARAQCQVLQSRLGPGEWMAQEPHDEALVRVTLQCRLKTGGGRVWFEGEAVSSKPRPDGALIRALQSAHRIAAAMGQGVVGAPESLTPEQAPPNAFDRKKARLAFLAPDIQAAILEGLQPPGLTLQTLLHTALPASWDDQRAALGFFPDRGLSAAG